MGNRHEVGSSVNVVNILPPNVGGPTLVLTQN